MAKRSVSKGDDGFFHVSGQAAETYYTDKETADRVGRQLDAADAEEAKARAGKHAPALVQDADEVS